jgi:hypothetical protein
MVDILQVLAVLFVAVALALAHALELPGKMMEWRTQLEYSHAIRFVPQSF